MGSLSHRCDQLMSVIEVHIEFDSSFLEELLDERLVVLERPLLLVRKFRRLVTFKGRTNTNERSHDLGPVATCSVRVSPEPGVEAVRIVQSRHDFCPSSWLPRLSPDLPNRPESARKPRRCVRPVTALNFGSTDRLCFENGCSLARKRVVFRQIVTRPLVAAPRCDEIITVSAAQLAETIEHRVDLGC